MILEITWDVVAVLTRLRRQPWLMCTRGNINMYRIGVLNRTCGRIKKTSNSSTYLRGFRCGCALVIRLIFLEIFRLVCHLLEIKSCCWIYFGTVSTANAFTECQLFISPGSRKFEQSDDILLTNNNCIWNIERLNDHLILWMDFLLIPTSSMFLTISDDIISSLWHRKSLIQHCNKKNHVTHQTPISHFHLKLISNKCGPTLYIYQNTIRCHSLMRYQILSVQVVVSKVTMSDLFMGMQKAAMCEWAVWTKLGSLSIKYRYDLKSWFLNGGI